MITQRMKNLIHLENSRKRFNQQGRFDRTARQVKAVFGVAEDFAPPGCLLPGLRFRQVKIRAATFSEQRFIVVEKVQSKIKQAAGNGFPPPGNMFFWQM
ncbi:Uncharacterised protein [Salmonella enterica subsp. enterica serovar Bovismorbificans]|nr:Uncharacterised protein [Salmonella enterica subsp. enterica serovar Bovismorbificans]